ncbi:MAG TPA: TolC family protein [Terriglobales bacterium]|nr:TolC family protein [Terriglobales bacterium]
MCAFRRLALTLLAATCLAVAQAAAPPPSAPALSLAQAQARARANSPDFAAALAAQDIAAAQHTQARAALLPSLSYNNSYLYTQGFRFIANNAVHEYLSQGNLHEALDFGSFAALRQAQAGQALARAQAEIAARGLAATVAADYYSLLAAEHKQATAKGALADAQKYLTISQDRERGGEVAHVDVIQAQIEVEQRQRALTEANLAAEQSRLQLAVLLFPNFNQSFTLVDTLNTPPPLPPPDQVAALARRQNPALAAASASLTQAQSGVGVARAALLPALTLDYYYGIDAPQFAARNQAGQPNLGSAATATLNIPIFDWGAHRATLTAAQAIRRQAASQFSFAQREQQAAVAGFYAEAQAAQGELASLLHTRDLAAQSLRLTALRYQDGEGTILELVAAQTAASDSRNAYDDGLVRYHVALAQLETLTGPLHP